MYVLLFYNIKNQYKNQYNNQYNNNFKKIEI